MDFKGFQIKNHGARYVHIPRVRGLGAVPREVEREKSSQGSAGSWRVELRLLPQGKGGSGSTTHGQGPVAV